MTNDNSPALQGLDAALAGHIAREAWGPALEAAKRLLAEAPAHPAALRGGARAAVALGQPKEALALFERILAAEPLDAEAWYMSALCAFHSGDASAYARASRACSLDPANPEFVRARRTIASDAIASWHFSMMNDTSRNFAYADAIARHVKGKLVLEIGTGAGLLALLTARAGARRVITCESNPVLADVAREIVAVNGFSDVITVVNKRSTDLAVGEDLPEKADVLVTETFSSLVIGEKMLHSLVDARTRLMKSGARVIPGVGAVCCALASSDSLTKMVRVDDVFGFDMDPLNRFVPTGIALAAPVSDIVWMSDAVDALAFDFNGPPPPLKGRARVELKATSAGRASGVVAWMRLDLDDQISFENRPVPDQEWLGHWKPYFFPFAHPLTLSAGQGVVFECFYTRQSVTMDVGAFARSGAG